jgi:hypothetical protein
MDMWLTVDCILLCNDNDSLIYTQGRFRPATFWKKNRVELVSPVQHKDRTMLTTFRLIDTDRNNNIDSKDNDSSSENWHVLNCHLQAGKQGGRRVRQIVEGNMFTVSSLSQLHFEYVHCYVCGMYIQV